MNFSFLLAATLFAAAFASAQQQPPRITQIVSFGASWTDSGAGLKLRTGDDAPKPEEAKTLVPDGRGTFTGRVSNGPTWVENLAGFPGVQGLGAELQNEAISGSACDFSLFGGATPGIPSVKDQIQTFVEANKANPVDPATTLFSIMMASQDVNNQLNLGDDVCDKIVQCVRQSMETLFAAASARNFLIVNQYPVNLSPRFKRQPPQDRINAERKSGLINKGLATVPAAFVAGKQGVTVQLFDVNKLYTQDFIANATQNFGSGANVKDGCKALGKGKGKAAFCPDPDAHLWFDDIQHPSRKAHQLIAQSIQKQITTQAPVTA